MDNKEKKVKIPPRSIEAEGSTVEEAIKKATDFFGVSRDEILVKVVCEEKRGLFGMEGEKPAKIRATIKTKKQNNS